MVINISGVIQYPTPGAFNTHPHAPGFGGEIAWNDIQAIRWLNGEIYRHNFNLVKQHNPDWSIDDVFAATPQDPIKWALKQMLVPYVYPMDGNGYPVQGYNQHDHTNEFFGGAIIGAGAHDHRGVGYGGYAFAVYHPGTRIPLRSLRIDT